MRSLRTVSIVGCHAEGEAGDVIGGVLDVSGESKSGKLEHLQATAHCEGGKCWAVAIDNVASFVAALGLEVPMPGLGRVSVDVARGGLWHVLVDAASVGLAVDGGCAARFVDVGERIKRAVRAVYTPVHPDRPACRGVSVVMLTGPLAPGPSADGPGAKAARSAVVMSPGRLDRSPCGTGSSARMAVLHARSQLRVGETFATRASSAPSSSAASATPPPSAPTPPSCPPSRATPGSPASATSSSTPPTPIPRASASPTSGPPRRPRQPRVGQLIWCPLLVLCLLLDYLPHWSKHGEGTRLFQVAYLTSCHSRE